MAEDKAARQISLIWCLRNASRYLSRDEIRRRVEQYRDLSDEAFERKFERDKKELRAAGIDIDTGSHDVWASDDIGYRIVAEGVNLPEIHYTPAEATMVSVALRAWSHSQHTASAELKLGVDDVGQAPVDSYLTMPSEVLLPVVEALHEGRAITFGYPGPRSVEPWGLVLHRGSWYLIGHDRDRDDRRVFKVDRIVGGVRTTGRAGACTIPEGADTTTITASEENRTTAVLATRRDGYPAITRAGRRLSDDAWSDQPEWAQSLRDSHDLIEIDCGYLPGTAGEVAADGPDVVVLDPPELRDAVIALLSGVVR